MMRGAGAISAVPAGGGLRADPRRHRRERLMRGIFQAAAWVSVIVTALIIVTLARQAIDWFLRADLATLWTIGWFPRRGMFDLPTLLIGTLLVSGIAMFVAAPLGLGAAIYLSEYARPRVRRVVKPVLETLAGVPSVVLGYFAISFITPNLLDPLLGKVGFFNLLSAGIAVGILTLPLVASVSEDALRAVPMALREAALGLGSRKAAVTLRVVFPAAISGIVAALVIGVSRAIGETMVVALAAGATGGSLRTWNVLGAGQTMTAAMASLAYGTDQVKGDALTFPSLFMVGAVLFIITLGLNIVGGRFVRRIRERY